MRDRVRAREIVNAVAQGVSWTTNAEMGNVGLACS